ncbi:hypothetical protein MTO96_051912 [Rhipicephalus appendiculatus]
MDPLAVCEERRDARPLFRPAQEADHAMVDGEQISKEDAESNGWITAHRKRNAAKTRVENETLTARQMVPALAPQKLAS